MRPATVALLLDDVQVGILRQVAGADAVLPNTLRVLAAVRKRRVRTVFLRHSFMPTEPAGAYQPWQAKAWQGKARGAEAARGAGRASAARGAAPGGPPSPPAAGRA